MDPTLWTQESSSREWQFSTTSINVEADTSLTSPESSAWIGDELPKSIYWDEYAVTAQITMGINPESVSDNVDILYGMKRRNPTEGQRAALAMLHDGKAMRVYQPLNSQWTNYVENQIFPISTSLTGTTVNLTVIVKNYAAKLFVDGTLVHDYILDDNYNPSQVGSVGIRSFRSGATINSMSISGPSICDAYLSMCILILNK